MDATLIIHYLRLLGIEEPISNTGDQADCGQLNRSLTDTTQSQFCLYNKQTIGIIALGSRKGIVQCQQQFATARWNCSTFSGDDLFGNFVNDGKSYIFSGHLFVRYAA